MSLIFTVSPDFNTKYLPGWFVVNTLLQRQTGEVALVLGLTLVSNGRLEFRVLLRVLGDQLLALFFALLEGRLGHGSPAG